MRKEKGRFAWKGITFSAKKMARSLKIVARFHEKVARFWYLAILEEGNE